MKANFDLRQHSIDASDPNSCYGRYINDSLSKKKQNCDFESYKDIHSAAIVATKNIKKGSEIYISYGINFWKEPRLYDKLSVADKQYVDNDGDDYT
jgi:SET domain-containing protein